MADRKDTAGDGDKLASDRRRPGRQEADPALVPLLRAAGTAIPDNAEPPNLRTTPALPPGEHADGPARGVALGILLSVPLWIAMILAGRALRRT